MPLPTITRRPESLRLTPNLLDYDRTRATFRWDAIRQELEGLPNGRGLNIAHEAVDRHLTTDRADHLAIRWLGKRGDTRDFSYRDLARLTNQFANVLSSLGVKKGERVFSLAGRIPELYIAALGTLKQCAVFCPLFSQFGPEPIRQRMTRGDAKVLITTDLLYKQKIAPIRAELTTLEHVLLVRLTDAPLPADTRDLAELMSNAGVEFTIPPTDPEDLALLHFTSGTTGMPKGAMHVHQAVLAHFATGRYALDLHPDDIFWCTADPGWVTGTSYGIITPLTHGVTSIVDEAEFEAERWYRNLQEQRVTVWYTAPTAVRMLMKAGSEVARTYDLNALRFVSSVGEPLNPEGVVWGLEAFDLPIHDNWWQTETGGIMIANTIAADIRPGSMGRPLPGITAAIVQHDEGQPVKEITAPNVQGELALKPGWPSMFRGYLHEEARYEKCFSGGWYLTGDLAQRDEAGYYWFVGRADDVIKSAGHLIGPFEVESALMEHPAVAEAGVIGKPDPTIGEAVKAFVSLRPPYLQSEDLRGEILGFGRKRLGAAVAPREIAFLDSIPKTRSGKIMRRLLKARELGLPEGDLSTLEQN